MTISSFEILSVPVSDQERAKKFYRDIWFDAMRPGGLQGVMLNVTDIDRDHGDLSKRGLVLSEIKRWLGWQDFTCQKSAADLCDLLEIKPPHMATALALLEKVGAITRMKRGRSKIIAVSPEGAFRGQLDQHNAVMERYKAQVVPLGHPTSS